MRFAISIPQQDHGTWDGAGLKAYVARAEELGFEGGWVMEQSIGPTPMIAPLELLAYAAAATERLRLGVAVLVSSLHDPLQLAAAATAVDRLSRGRLDLGLSPGGGFRKFAAFGVEPETFVSRFTEGLELMKLAWSDEPRITFAGRFRRVEDLPIQPKPVQRPHPPIWLGGAAVADTLDQVVEYGDGWMPTGPDAMDEAPLDDLKRRCEAVGRDPASITLGVYAPKADLVTLELLARRGFAWAALMVRPYDELATLDKYLPLLEHFGPLG